MAVSREQVIASELAHNGVRATLLGMTRQPSGQWFAQFEIDGEARLRDGRRVNIRRLVTTQMNQQIGRKVRAALG